MNANAVDTSDGDTKYMHNNMQRPVKCLLPSFITMCRGGYRMGLGVENTKQQFKLKRKLLTTVS
jgi:hypothetical protein